MKLLLIILELTKLMGKDDILPYQQGKYLEEEENIQKI